jgi:hypothetical protein
MKQKSEHPWKEVLIAQAQHLGALLDMLPEEEVLRCHRDRYLRAVLTHLGDKLMEFNQEPETVRLGPG